MSDSWKTFREVGTTIKLIVGGVGVGIAIALYVWGYWEGVARSTALLQALLAFAAVPLGAIGLLRFWRMIATKPEAPAPPLPPVPQYIQVAPPPSAWDEHNLMVYKEAVERVRVTEAQLLQRTQEHEGAVTELVDLRQQVEVLSSELSRVLKDLGEVTVALEAAHAYRDGMRRTQQHNNELLRGSELTTDINGNILPAYPNILASWFPFAGASAGALEGAERALRTVAPRTVMVWGQGGGKTRSPAQLILPRTAYQFAVTGLPVAGSAAPPKADGPEAPPASEEPPVG